MSFLLPDFLTLLFISAYGINKNFVMKSQRCFDLMWLQKLSLQVGTNSSNGFSSTLFSSFIIDFHLGWSEL